MARTRWLGAGVLAVAAALAAVRTAADPGGERLELAAAPPVSAAAFVRSSPPAPSPPSFPETDPRAVRREIEAANLSWRAAFRSGDTAALMRRYTVDASLVPPTDVALQGRERIAAYFGAQREAGVRDLDLRTLDVVRVGDLAYEVGTWGVPAAPAVEGQAGRPSEGGRYYAIWKSQPDGSWNCQVGIWSSDSGLALRR